MKKNKLYLIALLLGVMAMTFYSCEEKDDYNYDNIEPVIFSMTGPATTAAHGNTGFPVAYTVPERGGSTYAWVLSGHGGTFVQHEEFPSIAYITFNPSTDPTTATVAITETTKGGKVSNTVERTITLTPFCPVTVGEWVGVKSSNNFLGANDYGFSEVEVKEVTTKLNTIKVHDIFDWVVDGFWEETWIPGSGGYGAVEVVFDCSNTIKIDKQLLGTTYEFGPYYIWGSGTFDPDAKTITLNYFIAFSATGAAWNSFTAIIAAPTKLFSNEEINTNIPFPKK